MVKPITTNGRLQSNTHHMLHKHPSSISISISNGGPFKGAFMLASLGISRRRRTSLRELNQYQLLFAEGRLMHTDASMNAPLLLSDRKERLGDWISILIAK